MTQYDDPNREAVGVEPAWVEGDGGLPVTPKDDDAEPTDEPSAEPVAVSPPSTEDLDAMTKADLLDLAKSLGVSPANNDMTKEELRAGVDAALAS